MVKAVKCIASGLFQYGGSGRRLPAQKLRLNRFLGGLFLLSGLWGCTGNPGVADLSRDLYARYPARFLHAGLSDSTLHILMLQNPDTLSRSEWQANAQNLVRFILKTDYHIPFREVALRYQHIAAQVIIADSAAIVFRVNADSLRNVITQK